MSWKSIEMQVALPRTQDAGKLQENISKQSQQFQNELTQQQIEKDKLQQQRVNEFENIENLKTNDEQEEENASGEKSSQECEENITIDEQLLEHPYLGSHIDYSR